MHRAPTLREQELLAETLERDRNPFGSRDRAAEVLVTVAFLVAALALVLLRPPGAFELLPAAACVVVLALATRVHFHVASGFTVPTQLAFVPLLFAVPVGLVPLAVVLSLTLGRLPEVMLGRARPSRLLHSFGNSWFAVGPAAVLAAFDADPYTAGPALLLL